MIAGPYVVITSTLSAGFNYDDRRGGDQPRGASCQTASGLAGRA